MDRASIVADLLAGRRLGFACLVCGKPKMKSYDGRKWQNAPHLRVSIALLRDVFDFLDAIGVRLFRPSSQTAPYITHQTLPPFWHQLDECRDELADFGALARRYDLRLSIHPGQYTLLNATGEAIYAASPSRPGPSARCPKIHFSSQRLEERQVSRRDRTTGAVIASTVAPLSGQHAEYIDAGEFAQYLATVPGLPFDIMLGAKAKDLALLKLRDDLQSLVALSPAATRSS